MCANAMRLYKNLGKFSRPELSTWDGFGSLNNHLFANIFIQELINSSGYIHSVTKYPGRGLEEQLSSFLVLIGYILQI